MTFYFLKDPNQRIIFNPPATSSQLGDVRQDIILSSFGGQQTQIQPQTELNQEPKKKTAKRRKKNENEPAKLNELLNSSESNDKQPQSVFNFASGLIVDSQGQHYQPLSDKSEQDKLQQSYHIFDPSNFSHSGQIKINLQNTSNVSIIGDQNSNTNFATTSFSQQQQQQQQNFDNNFFKSLIVSDSFNKDEHLKKMLSMPEGSYLGEGSGVEGADKFLQLDGTVDDLDTGEAAKNMEPQVLSQPTPFQHRPAPRQSPQSVHTYLKLNSPVVLNHELLASYGVSINNAPPKNTVGAQLNTNTKISKMEPSGPPQLIQIPIGQMGSQFMDLNKEIGFGGQLPKTIPKQPIKLMMSMDEKEIKTESEMVMHHEQVNLAIHQKENDTDKIQAAFDGIK